MNKQGERNKYVSTDNVKTDIIVLTFRVDKVKNRYQTGNGGFEVSKTVLARI